MTGYKSKRAMAQDKLAQPAQEPEAWMSSDRAWMWSDYSKALAAVAHNPRLTLIPLYTTPPQRTWVGLTDEEIDDLHGSPMSLEHSGELRFVRAIEAKLKERNA